jgi:hypothetical protein
MRIVPYVTNKSFRGHTVGTLVLSFNSLSLTLLRLAFGLGLAFLGGTFALIVGFAVGLRIAGGLLPIILSCVTLDTFYVFSFTIVSAWGIGGKGSLLTFGAVHFMRQLTSVV